MLVTPQPPRFSVEEGAGLRLTLPCKKDWFRILFFGLWMSFWYVSESKEIPKVIHAIRSGEGPIFEIAWLAMWTFFGLYFSSWITWRLLGSEVLAVVDGIQKLLPSVGASKENYFPTHRVVGHRRVI